MSRRLDHNDKLIINRNIGGVETSFKTTASDIGDYLTEAPRPPGSHDGDHFVNDGEILIQTDGNVIELHSSNEWCVGSLMFKGAWTLTGGLHNLTIEHDFARLTDDLTDGCQGLDSTGDCLSIDMIWLTDNIVCRGQGLDSDIDASCIKINMCYHQGLVFEDSGCLGVALCPNTGIEFHPHDGCILLDMNFIAENVHCKGEGLMMGGDECIQIDLDWLSAHIRCGPWNDETAEGGSGLIDGGGCIQVDPCWVGDQLNPNNQQYTISDTTSINTDGCKIAVDEAWLLQWAKDNIQDLKVTGLCIAISQPNLFENQITIDLPEGCMDPWAVGVIRREIKDITVDGCLDISDNQNVALGEVNIKTNVGCIEGIIDNHLGLIKKGTGCVKFSGSGYTDATGEGDLTTGNVVIGVDNPCIQAMIDASLDGFEGGGSTGPTPKDGKLTIKEGANGIRITATNGKTHSANTDQNTTWTIDMDPASCPDFDEAISCKKLHLKESGGSGEPGIVIGTRQAANGSCIPGNGDDNGVNPDGSCKYGTKAWLGISSNQQNGSFTCIRGIQGWKDYDNCGGKPDGETEKLFSCAAGTRVLPHHASSGLITSNTSLAEDLRVFKYNLKPGDDDNPNGIVGGRPDQGLYNRFCFRKVNFLRGDIEEISRLNDARINFNIDDVIDAFGGYNDDPEVTDGIFRWGLKPLDEDPTHSYPFLFIDPQELAEKLPGFVDFTPDSTSWEIYESKNELGEVIDVDFNLKDDFDPATQLEPGAINWQAVHAVSIAAIAKHKKRIEELESLTTKAGMLNVLGIVEYTNETAAANSGLGQGEVYWDLELNRMRAVT